MSEIKNLLKQFKEKFICAYDPGMWLHDENPRQAADVEKWIFDELLPTVLNLAKSDNEDHPSSEYINELIQECRAIAEGEK